MKAAWIVSASLAGATHAWLLFGIQPEMPARARGAGDDEPTVELSVVAAAPGEAEPAAAVAAEPEPRQLPEPVPAPVESPVREPDQTPPTPVEPAAAEHPEPAATPPPRIAAKPRGAGRMRGANAAPAGGGAGGGAATVKARYRNNPPAVYPVKAQRAGQQGTVIFLVEITVEGRGRNIRLTHSSGYPLLDAAAWQAVQRYTYEPARAGGIPVASRMEVPIQFELGTR